MASLRDNHSVTNENVVITDPENTVFYDRFLVFHFE